MAELMPALRDELDRGSWRRNKLISSTLSKLPFNTRNWVASKLIIPQAMAQDARSYRAALTLGRLGKQARPAVPQLQKTAVSFQVWGSGWAIRYAQVALAMIQTDNAAVHSNALAALNSSFQP